MDTMEAQTPRAQGRPPAQQAAGTPRPIRFGAPVTDELRASETKMGGRGAFRVYRFEARADKRYLITMDAPDLDAYVWVARQVGVLTEELAADDDGGEGSNARLRFKPPANGSYFLVAQALSEDGAGAFTVQIVEQQPVAPPAARAIAIGQSLQGELTDDSPVREDDGDQPYDVYTIRGKGQRVRIVMTAESFDAYLHVYKVNADGEEQVATDDDGAGGTNARVTLQLDGEYKIIARSLGEDGRGNYEIAVSEAPVVMVVSRPIEVGQTVSGELTTSDPELDDGGYFHEYAVNAAAGDSFRITLRSGEFDSFLRWGSKNGDAFTEIDTDDDSGGDLDSMLSVRVTRSGTYVIRVSALGSGNVGPYTLTFERGN
jgi:hypothetical protein